MANGYPDFEGSRTKLFNKSDWSAVGATDIDILPSIIGTKDFGEYNEATYTVPAGKTVYITQASFSNRAVAAADADNNAICLLDILIDGSRIMQAGGNGGGSPPMPKPIVVEAGEEIAARCYNYSNHSTSPMGELHGYEI